VAQAIAETTTHSQQASPVRLGSEHQPLTVRSGLVPKYAWSGSFARWRLPRFEQRSCQIWARTGKSIWSGWFFADVHLCISNPIWLRHHGPVRLCLSWKPFLV